MNEIAALCLKTYVTANIEHDHWSRAWDLMNIEDLGRGWQWNGNRGHFYIRLRQCPRLFPSPLMPHISDRLKVIDFKQDRGEKRYRAGAKFKLGII